jgi:CBS domain-containing protein
MKKTVKQLIANKGSEVYSVPSDHLVIDALAMLADHNIGAVLVIDDGELVGIVSERDYARKVILKGRHSHSTTVGDIMTPDPVTVEPSATVGDCMAVMTEHRFRHLPVVEDGSLVGVISIGDVVLGVIDDQRFLIEQLESYITG